MDLGDDSLLSLFSGESSEDGPFSVLGVLLDVTLGILADGLSDSSSFLVILGSLGALSDIGVQLLVDSFEGGGLGLGEGGVPLAELLLESVLVFLLEVVHVALNVETIDVISVFLGIVGALSFSLFDDLASLSSLGLGLLEVISGESLGVVGHENTSINSTLESSENSVSSGGSNETNIKEGLEGSSVLDPLFVDIKVLSISGFNTLVEIVHAQFGEQSSGEEETGGVGSSVVGETAVDSESSELEGISLSNDLVALDVGSNDLGDDSSVGSSHNKSVLLGVVLVLILLDKSSPGVVVGLSFSSTSVLNLESLEVSSGLKYFHKCHYVLFSYI